MAMKKYNEYLQVNPSFESVVDIAADSRNKNLWREYIVGDDMEKLMDFLCQTLGYETPDAPAACGYTVLTAPVKVMPPSSSSTCWRKRKIRLTYSFRIVRGFPSIGTAS